MTLDDALLGCSAVRWHPFPGIAGVRVGVRALSDDERAKIRAEADDAVAWRDVSSSSPVSRRERVERELVRLTVARALLVDEGDGAPVTMSRRDLEDLDSETVDRLFGLVARAHETAFDGGESIMAAIDQLAKSPLERLRAREAANLCAYYGVACARVLTLWQLIIYARLARRDAP